MPHDSEKLCLQTNIGNESERELKMKQYKAKQNKKKETFTHTHTHAYKEIPQQSGVITLGILLFNSHE